MYLIFLCFNVACFVTEGNAHVCQQFNSLSSCIDNPLCQWCNTTTDINNKLLGNNSVANGTNSVTNVNSSGSCNMNTQCFYNNTECVSQLNYMCSLLNFFLMIGLLFILFSSMFYISYIAKNILDKYFDIPSIGNGEAIRERTKEKAIILTIINVLLFSPPIIFWIIGNIAFIYYSLIIMCLVMILSCSTVTTKYVKKNKEKSSYTQIN
jgi:hypothetical protein